MDINFIKYFVSVAQTLNFSEAARKNYVSQSTVSRGIKELEKELGTSLFLRAKRDVVLTAEGKALLPYAMEIIENLSSAQFTIEKLRQGIDGKITVGYDETSGVYIAKFIKKFVLKYPEITVDIKKIDTSDEIIGLDNGDLDVVFMLRDLLPDSPYVKHLDIFNDSMSIICRHGLIKKIEIDFDTLYNEGIVLLSESENPILYMEILDLFRTYNIIPKIVNRFDTVKSLVIAVSAGIGISILPTSLCRSIQNEMFDIHDIKGIDTEISYVMAWNSKMNNPGTQLFLKEVNDIDI